MSPKIPVSIVSVKPQPQSFGGFSSSRSQTHESAEWALAGGQIARTTALGERGVHAMAERVENRSGERRGADANSRSERALGDAGSRPAGEQRMGDAFFIERSVSAGVGFELWARVKRRPLARGFKLALSYEIRARVGGADRVYAADPAIARTALANGACPICEMLYLDEGLSDRIAADLARRENPRVQAVAAAPALERVAEGVAERRADPAGAYDALVSLSSQNDAGYLPGELEEPEWAAGWMSEGSGEASFGSSTRVETGKAQSGLSWGRQPKPLSPMPERRVALQSLLKTESR